MLLIGGPGFWPSDLLEYLCIQSKADIHHNNSVISSNSSERDVSFHKHRDKIVVCHASSGHKAAVDEMLESPQIQGQLSDVRALDDVSSFVFLLHGSVCIVLLCCLDIVMISLCVQVRILAEFHNMLTTDQNRACYSLPEVAYADSELAIQELLITDKLLHTLDFKQRKVYVELVESVRAHNGQVHVLHSLHRAGMQLDQYTGIAAILRFPLITEQQEHPSVNISSSSVTKNQNRLSNSSSIIGEINDSTVVLPPLPPTTAEYHNNNNISIINNVDVYNTDDSIAGGGVIGSLHAVHLSQQEIDDLLQLF